MLIIYPARLVIDKEKDKTNIFHTKEYDSYYIYNFSLIDLITIG